MTCSCGSRCSCKKRCVCHPDRCLCLPCYQLRGCRCLFCGLLCFSEVFRSSRGNRIDYCECYFVENEVPLQHELPQDENRDDVSESEAELNDIFPEPHKKPENPNHTFRPISSELSTLSSRSVFSEYVDNNNNTNNNNNNNNAREGENYLSCREETVEENTYEISKEIPSTPSQASNIARERKLEISPRKRNRSEDLNYAAEGMQEEMEVSNVVFPPKRLNIERENDVTEQSSTQTETCFDEQHDSEASISSRSRVHTSPTPTSASSTIPSKPSGESEVDGTKAEAAPQSASSSTTADRGKIYVQLWDCFEYYSSPAPDQNSSDPNTIEAAFYRYLGQFGNLGGNINARNQSSTNDSPAHQCTCFPDTPENPDTNTSTVEANKISPESSAADSVVVTSHNQQHPIPQSNNSYVCPMQRMIIPPRPIGLLPFPLRTPFPPFPSWTTLRGASSPTPNARQGFERPSTSVPLQMPSVVRPNIGSIFRNPRPSVPVVSTHSENAHQSNPSRVAFWVDTLPKSFVPLSPMSSSSTENAEAHASGTSNERQSKSENNDTHDSEAVAEEFDQSSDTEIYSMQQEEDPERD